MIRTKILAIIVILGLFLMGLPGCSPAQLTLDSNQSKVQVFVSLLPQAYFVEKVGGEHVQVSVLIPPGADPHTYEPTPRQMKMLAEADLYLKIGTIEFEELWMERLADVNPDMLVVDTSQSIELIDGDPHIWLSPTRAKVQAQNIMAALSQVDAQHQEDYQQNLEVFQAEMDQLDREISQQLKDVKHREFLVFHPAWRYFCEDYGLKEIPIERDGKEPTAQEMAQLIKQAKEKGIRVVLASPQHSTHEAEAIAGDLQGKVITIDPLARDYAANLRQVALELAAVLAAD